MRTSAHDRAERRRRARGFSLLEITIAIAILAGLTALAATQLAPATDRLRLTAEAREIANLAALVRTQALTSGAPTVIEIDADNNRIVYGEPPIARQLPASLMLLVAADAEGRRRRRVVFYPEGGSNGARFVIAASARQIAIEIDWLSGRIAISADVAGTDQSRGTRHAG